MRSRGLVSQNIASLDTALDALAAERTDSDHDGVPDIDELEAGSDPNVAGGGSVPPPSYGCFDVTGQAASPLRSCRWRSPCCSSAHAGPELQRSRANAVSGAFRPERRRRPR